MNQNKGEEGGEGEEEEIDLTADSNKGKEDTKIKTSRIGWGGVRACWCRDVMVRWCVFSLGCNSSGASSCSK